MSRKNLWIVLGLVVVVAAVAAWYFTRPQTSSTLMAASTPSGGEVIGPNEPHTMGNPKAKVTVIEYGAFTCPVCAYFDQEIFPAFKAKYIDTGKVFYVYRLYPIDAADGKAWNIAVCLPKSQFFPFIDLLYRRQADWGPEQHNEHGAPAQPQTEAGLLQMARIQGLGADQARACMNSKKEDARINQVAQDGEQRYQLTATPTLIVNGQPQQPGPIPLDRLSQVIDPLLK